MNSNGDDRASTGFAKDLNVHDGSRQGNNDRFGRAGVVGIGRDSNRRGGFGRGGNGRRNNDRRGQGRGGNGRGGNGVGGKGCGGDGRGEHGRRPPNANQNSEKTKRRLKRENRRINREIRAEQKKQNQRGERNRWEGAGYENSFPKFRDDRRNHFRFDHMNNANDVSNTFHAQPYDCPVPSLLGIDTVPPNDIPQPVEPIKQSKPESNSSSSSDESEDSVVRSLENDVNKILQHTDTSANDTKPVASPELPKGKSANASPITPKHNPPVITVTEKPQAKVKKEQNSKSDKSSTSSNSSRSSSEEEEEEHHDKPSSVEDVICLGDLEKFEDLIDDEEIPVATGCILCDEMGHISFHCQTICKNCNGKHHSLKDCPKPANLSIVFSNFIEFCLKQSCKYRPNDNFTVDVGEKELSNKGLIFSSGKTEHVNQEFDSKSCGPKSTRRRQQSSSSYSSDSDAERTSKRKRKRRNQLPDGQPTTVTIPFTVPYPPAYNSSFGFGPSGAVNPLLAFSHMMGYNHPAPIDFRGNKLGNG